MSLSFRECQSILRQFEHAFPNVVNRRDVHGVVVGVGEHQEPLIQVRVDSASDEKVPPTERQVPGVFACHIGSKLTEIRIEIIAKSRLRSLTKTSHKAKRNRIRAERQPRILIHPGDAAWGEGLHGQGSLGWIFILDGVLVCLSNWHVFCALGNSTPIGTNCLVRGFNEARLYGFQPLNTADNVWDLALAQINDRQDVDGTMRLCDDGGRPTFPMKFSEVDSVHVGDGLSYYKVGAMPPICRTGTLIGIGNVTVSYDTDNVERTFNSQLIFSKMTDRGDSGSTVIRDSDKSVTGLNFAGGEDESVANPIFLAGWQHIGTARLIGGIDIPMFTGSILPGMPKAFENVPSVKSFLGSDAGLNRNVFADPPIPGFVSIPGKLFLQIAVHREPPGSGPNSPAGWVIPPPPQIRPDRPIEMVKIRTENLGNFNTQTTYLCFH